MVWGPVYCIEWFGFACCFDVCVWLVALIVVFGVALVVSVFVVCFVVWFWFAFAVAFLGRVAFVCLVWWLVCWFI